MGQLGANLESTWGQLGPAWANLDQLGANLVQTWHNMSHPGTNLDPTWTCLRPKNQRFASTGTRILRNGISRAHPQKSSKNTILGAFWDASGKPGRALATLLRTAQGQQLGKTTPIQQGPAREGQKERQGRAQPGQDQPERAKMQGQQRQPGQDQPERAKKGRADSA